jgi:hypothetical protein
MPPDALAKLVADAQDADLALTAAEDAIRPAKERLYQAQRSLADFYITQLKSAPPNVRDLVLRHFRELASGTRPD